LRNARTLEHRPGDRNLGECLDSSSNLSPHGAVS
jgi:hypothetical protein